MLVLFQLILLLDILFELIMYIWNTIFGLKILHIPHLMPFWDKSYIEHLVLLVLRWLHWIVHVVLIHSPIWPLTQFYSRNFSIIWNWVPLIIFDYKEHPKIFWGRYGETRIISFCILNNLLLNLKNLNKFETNFSEPHLHILLALQHKYSVSCKQTKVPKLQLIKMTESAPSG